MKLSQIVVALTLSAICLLAASWAETPKKVSIAVVPKGANKTFWQAIHAGAMKARSELQGEGMEIDILWKGNASDRLRSEQIQIVDTFTGQRLSGILVASFDEAKFLGPVHVDSVSNLPMVYIDSALESDQPISYVATDNYQGGAMAADHIARLIEGEGNVIVLRHEIGNTNSEAREAGFIDRIRSNYSSVRLISMDRHTKDNYDRAYESSEYLLNRYGRSVNAVFVSSELGTVAMLNALREFKLSKQVFLVGYDSNAQLLEGIRLGEVQGIVVSNPFKMGYLGVTTLVDHMQGRNIPTVVNTGVTLVTEANIDTEQVSELLNPPIDEYIK